jgi:hypothetical protein
MPSGRNNWISESHPDYQRIITALNRENCPDCSGPNLLRGSRRALKMDLLCSNCGSKFTAAPWHFDQPPHLFRIVKRDQPD